MITSPHRCLQKLGGRLFNFSNRSFASADLSLTEAFPGTPTVSPANNFSAETKVTTLDNGLRVASRDTHEPTSVVGTFINCGSKFENGNTFGHSSFLERMAFKSSTSSTSIELTQSMERMGSLLSATSSRECLIYTAEVLRKFSDDALNMIQDASMNGAYHIHELNNAKHDYIRMLERNAKDAEVTMQDEIHEAAFGREGLGLSVFASRRTLDLITKETLREYVDTFFTPANMVVCGIGIDHNTMVDSANRYYGMLPARDVPTLPPVPEYKGGDLRIHNGEPLDNTHMIIALNAPDWKSDDLYAACVLHSLMGGGGSFSAGGPGKGMYSRLYLNVLNQCYFAESCSAFNAIYNDAALFGVYASCPSEHAADMANRLVTELKGMADPRQLGKEELDRAKNHLKSEVLLNLESRSIAFEDLGRQVLTYGQCVPASELVAKISAVTNADVLRVASQMLSQPPSVVVRGNSTAVPHYPTIAAALKAGANQGSVAGGGAKAKKRKLKA